MDPIDLDQLIRTLIKKAQSDPTWYSSQVQQDFQVPTSVLEAAQHPEVLHSAALPTVTLSVYFAPFAQGAFKSQWRLVFVFSRLARVYESYYQCDIGHPNPDGLSKTITVTDYSASTLEQFTLEEWLHELLLAAGLVRLTGRELDFVLCGSGIEPKGGYALSGQLNVQKALFTPFLGELGGVGKSSST